MGTLAPSNPRDRFEVYRFFNGLSSEAKEGLDQRRTRVPLVKTFLLEHVACRGNGRPKPPAHIFASLGAKVRPIDDRFMGLSSELFDANASTRSQATTGFLEQYDDGNTFHRLLTNIQHYICPKIRAWVGAEPFEDIVRKWPDNPEEFRED